MKILLLGGTGGIGGQVCKLAGQKHELVALVRAPEKLPAGVRAIKGDPLLASDVAAAAQGCDACISALGPRPKGDESVVQKGATALLHAPIERIIIVSAAMLYSGVVPAIVRMFLPRPTEDLRAMEQLVVASTKDWTIARPPRLLNKPGKGSYKTAIGKPAGRDMAREDVARALLDIAEQHLFPRQIVALG